MRVFDSRRNVSASSLPRRGWTPRPGTLIVYAPVALATMPIPSYTISAGLSRAAQSGSEVRIMFPGREDIGRKRRCPQKRCVDGVDVRTGLALARIFYIFYFSFYFFQAMANEKF